MNKPKQGIYIDDSIKDTFDGIVFDCDGVLVDIKQSYDAAIDETVHYILEKFLDISNPPKITHDIIDAFKASGGFNDEIDLSYASILSIYTANKLDKRYHEFLLETARNANPTGISSVENFLNKLLDISGITSRLDYPNDSDIDKIFNQLFYGPDLYLQRFGKTSEFTRPGLIKNDIIILDDKLADKLKSRFDKLAIVTGRSRDSVLYSLKDLFHTFDDDSSMFLEDEPRDMAKPNPKSLYQCVKSLDIQNCLYVGDSIEDFIMACSVTDLGRKITFCGIIGTSKNPQAKLELFQKNDIPIILDSIHDIPKILNLVSS